MIDETTRDKQAKIDAWMAQVNAKARDYVRQGLSLEDAEERAVNDIRREIRAILNSHGGYQCGNG